MASNLDIGKYTPLMTIVAVFLDAHEKSAGDQDKAWILAFRALAKLNYSFAALPKSIRLPVNANKTVDLPTDYLMWSKIGIMDHDGKINSLKINNSISTLRDTNPNRLTYLTPDINSGIDSLFAAPFFFNFFNNGVFQNMYFGVQGGLIQYGECRIDEKNRVIILDEHFKYDHVLMEYISSPQRDNDYVVDNILTEPIIAFLEWKTGVGQREEFYACCVEARRSMPGKRVTLQNINEIIRQTQGMYLKA